MAKLLIFGGTGIVGNITSQLAAERGFEVTVIGKEKSPEQNNRVKFVLPEDIKNLERQNWDVIFDVYNFDSEHSEKLYEMFKDRCRQFIILSTTLVYDRSKYSFQKITEDFPLAKLGEQGGYVDHKLKIEKFWHETKDENWTVLRPYHIIGPNSYLGCLPPHNRNPGLLDIIKNRKIKLCDGGRIPLNILHPKDLAEVVLRIAGNQNTFGKNYNVVNPNEIIARDYFLKIAELLGVELEINSVSGEEIWNQGDWKLTTLPHLYDVSKLFSDIGYVPETGLEECLRDAIVSQPENQPEKFDRTKTEVYARMHLLPEPQLHKYFNSH